MSPILHILLLTEGLLMGDPSTSPDLIIQGIFFALIMGFFGGLFPALRAARQQIAGTLRGI